MCGDGSSTQGGFGPGSAVHSLDFVNFVTKCASLDKSLYGHFSGRFARCVSFLPEIPSFYCGGGAIAGPGYRGEHGHFYAARSGASAAVAREGPSTAPAAHDARTALWQ